MRSTWDYIARREEFLAWADEQYVDVYASSSCWLKPRMLKPCISTPVMPASSTKRWISRYLLLRRAARNRDDYDDLAIEFDDVAFLELGFLVYGGEANKSDDARIRKVLEHPPNLGGFRLKPSH